MGSKMAYLVWQSQRWRKRLTHIVCSKLYRNPDTSTDKSIMVAGTARSGTTWLASIIASQISCRMMFEPFHSKKVKAFAQFHYFHYMRPAEQNLALRSYCQTIFSGDIRHRWIDRRVDRIFSDYRLIKDVRANLFLKWTQTQFPKIPLFFIIRHPCAVVLSRMQLDWATETDIEPFLAQPNLIEDFLADKMDVIARAQTAEEKHAVIWCISNLVPLKQFGEDELNLIFYENLCTQPEVEIPRIFQVIGQPYQNSVFERAGRPSTTTIRTSAVVSGHNKVTRWQEKLSTGQIDNILAVVQAFGLDYLYGDSFTPLETNRISEKV